MAKMPLAWHKKNLVNFEAHYEREVQKLADMQKQVARTLGELQMLQEQVRMAEFEGKDGFDAEKYLRKRERLTLSGGC